MISRREGRGGREKQLEERAVKWQMRGKRRKKEYY